jgi:hypothetical protein
VYAQLKTHAPDGVDVFFDNTGGAALEAALNRLARGDAEHPLGPRGRRANWRGRAEILSPTLETHPAQRHGIRRR